METLINHKKFAQRLQKIMDEHELSATSFAEKLDVGRATISHILSGRNKPSLDFVMKVVAVFKTVDLQWLIYGTLPDQNLQTTAQKNAPTYLTNAPKNTAENNQENTSSKPTQNSIEKLTKMSTTSSPIKRVILFKEDGTFESYEMP